MAGILTRFKDIMSSNINALLDKAEDPEKMIDQCLRNLNSDLGKVKAETAAVMAEATRAKRELDECDKDIKEMENYAMKAVKAGNDEDAKRFLEKKAVLVSKREALAQAEALASENATKMRQMHDKLSKEITELEARKQTIKSKIQVAKTQEKINKMNSSVTTANNSIGAFERMEAKANNMLDKANAMAELNTPSADSVESLMDKYGASSASVDDELAALKEQMGVNVEDELAALKAKASSEEE